MIMEDFFLHQLTMYHTLEGCLLSETAPITLSKHIQQCQNPPHNRKYYMHYLKKLLIRIKYKCQTIHHKYPLQKNHNIHCI